MGEVRRLRVVAPSRSLTVVDPALRHRAAERLAERGFAVDFGSEVTASGLFETADPEDRARDLHDAYADDSVDALLSVIGGTRCADVLPLLDWDLIAAHPKPLCGFSDVTALLNALWARAGVPGLLGPHFSSWAMTEPDDYQAGGFLAALTGGEREVRPSTWWSDSPWYLPGAEPDHRPSAGPRVLREGEASGTAVGGNLSTLRNILGTSYAPSLDGAVLLVEDTDAVDPKEFRRGLQAVSHATGFEGLAAVLIGRFGDASGMTPHLLGEVLDSLPAYADVPCLADVDFGHTQPIATFPIGGELRVAAVPGAVSIVAGGPR